MDEVDSIHAATERLLSSMGDTPEMVRQARILALVRFTSLFFLFLYLPYDDAKWT